MMRLDFRGGVFRILTGTGAILGMPAGLTKRGNCLLRGQSTVVRCGLR